MKSRQFFNLGSIFMMMIASLGSASAVAQSIGQAPGRSVENLTRPNPTVQKQPSTAPVKYGIYQLNEGGVMTVSPEGIEITPPKWCEEDCRNALLGRLRAAGYPATLSVRQAGSSSGGGHVPAAANVVGKANAMTSGAPNTQGGNGNIVAQKRTQCDAACMEKLMKEIGEKLRQLSRCAVNRLC